MKVKRRILIVEDEQAILTGLQDVLIFHGYEVDSAMDGESGLEKSLTGSYDLILLDVMLPGIDGFTICNKIREHSRDQPVMMLTAKTSEEDIINGLSLGADDYVPKPFSVRELVLRIEAVLRRSRKLHDREQKIILSDFMVIDPQQLQGSCQDSEDIIPFTKREILILQYLKENNNRAVSRDELLKEVWDYSNSGSIETRTVDIHIAKLRRKIEPDNKNPVFLVTVRGQGYRLFDGVSNG